MWSGIIYGGAKELGGAIGWGGSSAVALETAVLINQYAFIPLLETLDTKGTELLYGKEEATKTAYEWALIKQDYLNPVLNFISVSNKALSSGERTERESSDNSSVSMDGAPSSVSAPSLAFTESGAVRDQSKIGPSGATATKISDEEKGSYNPPMNSLSEIASSMTTDRGEN